VTIPQCTLLSYVVPILDTATLASAFQIVVFGLINLAVVAFREGGSEYDPEFTTPLYPWLQGFGVLTGGLLLTQMGTVAIAGAVVITAASVVWYRAYVRPWVSTDGAAADAVRQRVGVEALTETESAMTDRPREVLVALTKDLDAARERSLVALAPDLVRADDGRLHVVRFQLAPDEMPLTDEVTAQSSAAHSFEARVASLGPELGVELEADEVVSHDTKHAIANLTATRGTDTVAAEHELLRPRSRLFGDPIDWVVRHAPDVSLVDNVGYDRPDRVALVGDGAPSSPLSVNAAETFAVAHGAALSL
jgi:hypothetical protein